MPNLTRQDRLARLATPGLLALVLLVGGGNLWATYDQAGAVRRAAATTTQLCEAGNMARAQQVTLWTRLVAISQPPPHQTPAQARDRGKTIRAFLAYVGHLFAPRNCQAPLTTRRNP